MKALSGIKGKRRFAAVKTVLASAGVRVDAEILAYIARGAFMEVRDLLIEGHVTRLEFQRSPTPA